VELSINHLLISFSSTPKEICTADEHQVQHDVVGELEPIQEPSKQRPTYDAPYDQLAQLSIA
jgi:hypothetical protein